MFDTIKIKSPIINNNLAFKIENECIVRSGLDMKSGEYIYCITSGTLTGTYDNRISIRVLDDTVKYEGKYVIIEGSINKLLFGHNIKGDSRLKDIDYCVRHLVSFVENSLGIMLPFYREWYVMRIDYSINYKIGHNNVVSWFEQMNNIYYPRRRVIRHGLESIMFPGSTTTLKMYDKHKEYKAHDYKVLKNINEEKADKLLFFSYGIIRIEVEIKKRKFEYDLNKKNPTVEDIESYNFNELYNNELKKIFKMGEEMKICNDSIKVEKRLKNVYGDSLGDRLFSTWLKLSVFGYDKVKNTTSKSTFYRHIGQLKDAGVTWIDTDITVLDNNNDNVIPIDFMFRKEYMVS